MIDEEWDFVPGKRYRVFHQSGSQKYVRFSVMDFLGENKAGDYEFSARPVAGTQTMPRSWIVDVERVGKVEAVCMNKRGEPALDRLHQARIAKRLG